MNANHCRVCLALISFFTVIASAVQPIVVLTQTNNPVTPPHSVLLRLFLSDAAGNTFAVGRTFNDPAGDTNVAAGYPAVVKFGPDGQVLWTRLHGFYSQAMTLAIDAAGNVYLAGNVNLQEGFILKLTGAGESVWTNRFRPSNPGPVPHDMRAWGIAVDGNGSAAVIFQNYSMNMLAKINPDGTLGWEKDLGLPSNLSTGSSGVGAWYLAVFDPSGNIAVTGPAPRSAEDLRPVAATMKFSPDGTMLWSNRFDRSLVAGTGVVPDAITTDRRGNVFITTFAGTQSFEPPYIGHERRVIVSYTPGGRLRWANQVPDLDTLLYPYEPSLPALETDHDGSVYLAVMRYTTPNTNALWSCETVVAKFGPHGARHWFKRHPLDQMWFAYLSALQFSSVERNHVTLYHDELLLPEDEEILTPGVWARTTLRYQRRP